MATINLRDFYPSYTADMLVEVPNEVAAMLYEVERLERNYRRRVFYNRAHYSLDAGDGIEQSALFVSMSPCELYERKLTMEQLYAALNSLPEKQGLRVHAHYILGISKADIARAEGIQESAVRDAIDRGLKSMERYLKNI